jgi:hypothetical protein
MQIGKKDDKRFIVLLFTLRTSRRLSFTALLRARGKNYDFTLKCLVERSEIPLPGHMKASDSCKLQV